jgi:predicted ATPase
MPSFDAPQFVTQVRVQWDLVEDRTVFPFSLPAIAHLQELELHRGVTFIVGENGSGKSTLVEAIAVAWGFNPEGGSKNFTFSTRGSHSDLHKFLRFTRSVRRARDGYFLRAESYFNVASNIEELDRQPSYSRPLIGAYGGVSLHEQSHGESFMALLNHRFRGEGLYILDEPEAALSPTRQLAMLVRMNQLVNKSSQFVIATHSPILLAYPDAWIYQITSDGLTRVTYQDTEHYQVTLDFLQRYPERLRKLLRASDDSSDESD